MFDFLQVFIDKIEYGFNFLKTLPLYIWDKILSCVDWVVNLIDIDVSFSTLFDGLPSDLIAIANHCGLDTFLTIVASCLAIRFVIMLIPTIG